MQDRVTALQQQRLAQAPDAIAFIEAACGPDGREGPDGPDGPDSREGREGRRLTQRELDQRIAATAAWLAAQGVRRGDTVAVWLVNRLDWLAIWLALARLGAALMTVNTRYRGAEVAYLLERSRPRLLVLQRHFRRLDFPAVLADVDPAAAASVERVVVVDAGADGAPDAQPLPPELLGKPTLRFDLFSLPLPTPGSAAAAIAADDPALADAPTILFTTSGTTSGPKLVVHSQRSVAIHLQRVGASMGMGEPGAMLLAALPLAGTFGFISTLAAWNAGAPVLLLPTWDTADAHAALTRYAVSHFFGSDEMFEALLARVPADAPSPVFPSLRLCGYAAFRAGAVAVAEAALARGLPMAGLYGSSEVHALFSIQRADRPTDERLAAGGSLSNPDAEVRVRDAETGALLPDGATGLLEIRAPSNFIGYLNQPEATAQAIDAEGFFRTGDIGHRRADGSFVYLTRAGDAIRLGGYLVAPAEIEEAIKALPGVAAAQVVAVELGGKTRAVAFAIAEPGAAEVPDAQAVINRLDRQLAAFKVPARVWWVEAFPVVMSANGTKIQRTRLRDWARQRLAAEGPAADAAGPGG